MPYCPQCGSEVDPDDAYCGNCGHALDGPPDEGEQPVSGGSDDRPGDTGREPTESPDTDTAREPSTGRDAGAVDAGGRVGSDASGDADASGSAVEADDGEQSQGPPSIDVPADPFELDVFEFSFKYPFARGYKPVGIGALLILGSIFLFPLLFLMGYGYRVGRAAARGDATPPAYDDWWGLLVDGFRYGLVSVIVGVLAGGGFFALALLDLQSLAILWYFGSSIASAAVLPIFFGTGSLTGVFSGARFLRFMFTVEFWIGYAYLLGVMLVLYIGTFVAMIVLLFTFVGVLFWIPLLLAVAAYGTYVSAALWGRVYRDAAEDGVVDPVQDPERLESTW